MHLTLTPQAGLPGQPEMTIHVSGETLTLDWVDYDLSSVPEGENPFVGPIRRIAGVIHATLVARLGDTAADDQPDSPWVIPEATDEIAIPAIRQPADTDPGGLTDPGTA